MINENDRVRVMTADGQEVVGTVISISGETAMVRLTVGGETMNVPFKLSELDPA